VTWDISSMDARSPKKSPQAGVEHRPPALLGDADHIDVVSGNRRACRR
jgi:hypothetical protein